LESSNATDIPLYAEIVELAQQLEKENIELLDDDDDEMESKDDGNDSDNMET
jgi:hypothetical protein